MVRFVNAQNFGSDIADAIKSAGAMLYGDTLTPALKKEQLVEAQNKNIGLQDFQTNIRDWARTAPAGGGNMSAPTTPIAGRDEFLSTIAPHAVTVGQRIGVDPRIIVAQSALETGWGRSAPGNNFFGIKSHGQPGGQTLSTKEVVDGQTVNISDSFRTYGSAADSVAGYGDFLTTNPRYAPMLGAPDFESQIAALGASGYATDPEYASKVRQIAEGIDLSPWTGSAPTMPPATASPMTGAPATDPGTYNPNSSQMFAELLANGVAAGASPDDVMSLILGMTANMYGAENQATVNAGVGAKVDYARTYSGFAADQNRQMWDTMFEDQNEVVDVIRNGQAIRIRKGEMQPGDQAILSDTEQKAIAAQGLDMDREETLAYVGAEPKNVQTADRYYSATSGQYHPSYDGITDATTGQPLPPDAAKTSVVAPSRADAGLTGPVETGIQNQIIGLENFRGQLQSARDVAAADATLFGPVGQTRTLFQNLGEQFRQLQATAPETAAAIENDTQSMLDNVLATSDPDGVFSRFMREEYDPNLSALHLYGQLLPYAAAAALAQQEGRGLSNQDVERFSAIVGDPTGFWSTQRGFLTRLDLLDREVERLLTKSRGYLESGVGAAGETTPGAATPAAPAAPGQAATAAPALPAPEDIAAMSPEDLTSVLQLDISGIPTEVLEPFLDAVARRQAELGIQ